MSQTYSVRINRKDLYKGNYNQKEYKDKEGENKMIIKKSLVDILMQMSTEYT